MTDPIRHIDQECLDGYRDGRDLDSPNPGPNRSAAYRHGWQNGRDDAEVSAGLRRFPSRTAQETRNAWAVIEAQDGASAYVH